MTLPRVPFAAFVGLMLCAPGLALGPGQGAPAGDQESSAAALDEAREARRAQQLEESLELTRRESVADQAAALLRAMDHTFAETHRAPGAEELGATLAEDACSTEASALTQGTRGPAPKSRIVLGTDSAPIAAERFSLPDFALEADTGPLDAIDQIAGVFDELRRSLGGGPSRPGEIKIKEVLPVAPMEGSDEGSDEGSELGPAMTFDLRARVRHQRAPASGTPVSVQSRWRLRVRVEDDQLRLIAFQGDVENVVQGSVPPELGGFVDVSGSVLTEGRSALLSPAIAELRDLLDSGLGVGVLGHHGVAVVDLTGDGIDDIYLSQPGGIPNQLWVRTEDGTAVEAAAAIGLDFVDATTSALFVDLDGDGDRDGVFGLEDGVHIFVRKGQVFLPGPSFERGAITGLAAGDTDGDGLVDLYACAYANPYNGTAFPVPYHDAENGAPNLFLINRTETADELVLLDATEPAGLMVGASRFSFAATFEDFDGDGDADLYVANDFGRNALYVNTGAGIFSERASDLGAVDIAAGMAASFADLNGDGLVDLYVANMESSAGRRITGQEVFQPRTGAGERDLLKRHAKGNTLFLGEPGGGFRETDLAAAGQWAWGAIPIELDGNGALDLYVPNGFVTGSKTGPGGKAPDL